LPLVANPHRLLEPLAVLVLPLDGVAVIAAYSRKSLPLA
jgi:hypothetical protein